MTQAEQALAILSSAADQALLNGQDRDRVRASAALLNNLIQSLVNPTAKETEVDDLDIRDTSENVEEEKVA